MKIVYLDTLNPPKLPCLALTIGNFDGVHLGHQAMIKQLLTLAWQDNLSSAVMIFEPQPKEFFDPKNAPTRLTSLDEKLGHFKHLGVDIVLVARFDDVFCQLSACQFATLLQRLNAKSLILGDDFRFGANRIGDDNFLKNKGFIVHSLTTVSQHGDRISSTKVRNYLAQGNLAHANALLGYDYYMIGKVIHGNKLGRQLGFPTANISLNRLKPAPLGVWAVSISGINNSTNDNSTNTPNGLATKDGIFGCASIGVRPSVNLGNEWRCEIFLPNFTGDLYDKTLKVTFLYFLHGETRYDSLQELTDGISQDVKHLTDWYHRQNFT